MSKCCGLYESEYQYGLRMEKLLHPIFNNIFNKQFKETDKFCVYYFFKFIDNDKKLYYWKFDEKELEEEIGNNTFYIRDVVRRDRPEKKPVPHLNIPCRFLTEIKYTDNI